jgi:hypothetical protein
METYGGADLQIRVFLTSALVGGEWSASRPGRFTPGTHWIGGWVGPRTGLDVERRKILLLPGIELRPLGRPARSLSPYRLRYPGSPLCCSSFLIFIHICSRALWMGMGHLPT